MGEDLADESKTVQQVFDSTLESVDHAERMALDMARESGFEEADLDRIGMSVRECMVNAVVHGNRYNSHKKVQFSASRTPESFTIRIADQGEGFDPGELPDLVYRAVEEQAATNLARVRLERFGEGRYQECRNAYYKNALDGFLVELGKWGLGPRDLAPNVNFFSRVTVADDGGNARRMGGLHPGGDGERVGSWLE
jgi:hypothetical protein